MTDPDVKRHAPATLRNRAAIVEVLADILPAQGRVLEIASGSGEHIVHFAAQFPNLEWQPSDPDPAALASIVAWTAESGLTNIAPPIAIDARSEDWPIQSVDAIICINMIHISPWSATMGLFVAAGRRLPPGAPLYVYGPFRRADVATAPSNEAFDESLRSRNSEWGVRKLEAVEQLAAASGLVREAIVEMPANNLSAIWRKQRSD